MKNSPHDLTTLVPTNHTVEVIDKNEGTYIVRVALLNLAATVKAVVNMDKNLPANGGELPSMQLTFQMPGGGVAPAGTAPARGTAPVDTTPVDTTPAGNAPAGSAPAGNAPAGSAPAGDAPAGNAPAGNAPGPAGNAPAGNAPASS